MNMGLSKEKEYFIENLAILLSSGMDIISVLKALGEETKSRRMRKVIEAIGEDVAAG